MKTQQLKTKDGKRMKPEKTSLTAASLVVRGLQRDPAGRYCSRCSEEIAEDIPLDINGTCHGCGSNFGKKEGNQ